MMNHYIISLSRLGRDIHSKVYSLLNQPFNTKLIVKIYEKDRHKYYKKEKEILDILNNKENNTNNFIMYKQIFYNQNMFRIPKEIKGDDLEFLFFDFLPNLSLEDYIIETKKEIKEIHAKYLCYKLLMIIKNLKENNISHNNINISNIFFDDNFNPKLIHFSEANIINKIKNKNLINYDLYKLGETLAKIVSLGKLETIIYNKKENVFKIKLFNQSKFVEESFLWKQLKNDNINISDKFIDFFHLIIYAKKSNDLLEIDEIMKNEWLSKICNDLEIHQKNFENDFKIMNKTIRKIRNEENKFEINIKVNDIINLDNKEDDYHLYNNNIQQMLQMQQ